MEEVSTCHSQGQRRTRWSQLSPQDCVGPGIGLRLPGLLAGAFQIELLSGELESINWAKLAGEQSQGSCCLLPPQRLESQASNSILSILTWSGQVGASTSGPCDGQASTLPTEPFPNPSHLCWLLW